MIKTSSDRKSFIFLVYCTLPGEFDNSMGKASAASYQADLIQMAFRDEGVEVCAAAAVSQPWSDPRDFVP
jgi:hypothetical protein